MQCQWRKYGKKNYFLCNKQLFFSYFVSVLVLLHQCQCSRQCLINFIPMSLLILLENSLVSWRFLWGLKVNIGIKLANWLLHIFWKYCQKKFFVELIFVEVTNANYKQTLSKMLFFLSLNMPFYLGHNC